MWAHINGVLKVQSQVEEIRKAATAIHNHFSNTAKNLESLRKAIDATNLSCKPDSILALPSVSSAILSALNLFIQYKKTRS